MFVTPTQTPLGPMTENKTEPLTKPSIFFHFSEALSLYIILLA